MVRRIHAAGVLLAFVCWAALSGCTSAQAGAFYEDASGGGGGASVTQAAYASCGSGSAAGDVCVTTDGPLWRVWDGSAWDDYLPGSGPVTAPPDSGWSWVNQGSSTVATAGGVRSYSIDTSTTTFRGQYRSAPSTPYEVEIIASVHTWDEVGGVAIGFREAATSEWVTVEYQTGAGAAGIGDFRGPPGLYVQKRTSGLSFGSNVYTGDEGLLRLTGAFRVILADDGTDLTIDVCDVTQCEQVWTEASGTYLTPDQLGIAAYGGDPTAGTSPTFPLSVMSWREI